MRRQRFRDEVQPGEILAFDPTAMMLLFAPPPPRAVEVSDDGVAVMAIEGPLEHRSGGCWDSYEAIVERFEESLAREDVRALVLRIDSPGGETDGLLEAVRSIQAAKVASGKPVYAYADECAASAAYAIACAADEIYLPAAAGVGSIGVIATLLETTSRDEKEGLRFELVASGLRKADGNPHVPISDGARKRATARVQQLAGMFFELVSRSRGIPVDDVDELEADVFYGESAVDLRLADGVMTWPEMLEHARSSKNNTAGAASGTASDRQAPASAKGERMNLEALKKKQAAAKAALVKATTERAKRAASAAYGKACADLALAEATLEARKMKKTRYVEETLDDSADEDAEDAEESEDAEDESEDGKKAASAGSGGEAKHTVTVEHEDDEDEEDEDEESKAQRADHSGVSLEAMLAKLTGKRSRSAMIGAIEGAFRAAEQARKDVAKLKADTKAAKIDRLLSEAREAGKVTRGELPTLRQAALTNGVGWLKANLEQRPAIVRREELMPKEFEGLAGKVPADVAAVFAKMGLSKEQAEKAGALFAERNGQNGVVR